MRICKQCAHGTMRKNEHGKPKGYCKALKVFAGTIADDTFCTAFCMRDKTH